MNIITDDKQFVALFGEPIASEYNNALMLMDVHADASLMMFRKAIESLCLKLARHYHYEFISVDLHDQINELARETFINGITKESFHKIRKQTNTGVHQPENTNKRENLNCFDSTANKSILKNQAMETRIEILNLLELTCLELKVVNKIPKYDLSAVGGQECKDLLFRCLTSTDHKDHFLLGLVYQVLAEDQEHIAHYDNNLANRPNSHYLFASECYKNGFFYSTGLHISDITVNKGKGITINPNGYESLFHYVMLSITEKVNEINSAEEELILRILVKRRYGDAYAPLGWKRYLAGHFKEGLKIISNHKAKVSKYSLHKQGLIYLEGKACPSDINLSLECLQEASGLGCADSLLELGKLYHKGEHVEVDAVLARDYLNQAIAKGNNKAIRYMTEDFIDLKGAITSAVAHFSKMFNSEIKKLKAKPLRRQISEDK